jgi:hypothetical protein
MLKYCAAELRKEALKEGLLFRLEGMLIELDNALSQPTPYRESCLLMVVSMALKMT